MRQQRVAAWLWAALIVLPADAVSQQRDPRAERLASVERWIGVSAADTVEDGPGRLWDLPALRQAASEAMGPALAREALKPAGPETPVVREGRMLRWSWCRRGDCGGLGYVFVVDPRRGDLYACRSAEQGRQGWMGNDPRMHIPIRGRTCDAANVSEFIRLNTRP
ncbi:hypothetical protein [Reyranella sp. CPCC 100927]|uniref:hypothetical protein n=1 Tax=Reyranella sp. CPCC 100927 TaxID=2599616 RepID=UPI0011B5EEB6|nr:hypothetical protein [Reyranella sp. CPCC 100927]TWT10115.1 hypothetical protein FQU96_18675 [Reyranella sp. CPCC 100927]